MAVLKRIAGRIGSSDAGDEGRRTASSSGWVCPHCHAQSRLIPMEGRTVCQLCGRSPQG